MVFDYDSDLLPLYLIEIVDVIELELSIDERYKVTLVRQFINLLENHVIVSVRNK